MDQLGFPSFLIEFFPDYSIRQKEEEEEKNITDLSCFIKKYSYSLFLLNLALIEDNSLWYRRGKLYGAGTVTHYGDSINLNMPCLSSAGYQNKF